MRDTDWRPSACPKCGRTREAAEHPVCENCDRPKRKPAIYHSRMIRGYAGSLTSALNTCLDGAVVELDGGAAQGIREALLEWARRMDGLPTEDQPPVDRKDGEADQAQEKLAVMVAPFRDSNWMNQLLDKLGLDIGKASPGQLVQNTLLPVLDNIADRIIALEKGGTPGEEAVAARCAFDGYGWRYLDSGSGPDWKTRAAQYPDCEWLYARGVA